MMKHSYKPKEIKKEDAILQVEKMMRKSRMVGPRVGFTTRWVKRYRRENEKVLRKQATFFVVINSIIAVSLLGVIGWMYFNGTSSFNGAVAKIVSQLSSSWAEFQAVFQVTGAVIKVVPNVMPVSWWPIIVSVAGISLLAWYSKIKKSFGETGNK